VLPYGSLRDGAAEYEDSSIQNEDRWRSISNRKSAFFSIFSLQPEADTSSQQYTCPSGYPSPEYIPAICRICHGTCTRPVLNDLSSPYKVNGGGEGKSPRWNNAACPWIFSLIPGVDESFVTSSGKRRRGMSRDLMSKLDRERKDDWALLFAT
jgi:hypothetical protein